MKKLLLVLLCQVLAVGVNAQTGYRVDGDWPRSLPDNQILGQVSGIAVDDNDTIWVVHRPRTLRALSGIWG